MLLLLKLCYKIKFAIEYTVFQKVNNEYITTHGFTKKSQKTPSRKIEHAKRMI
ncbi:type II toxin-antitoxin system RelE/ParE family toxin (plasmid) [Staphylococcus aureus]|nr:type II toxin-antitoxin system RelE/ParE family toxin [Staphylococcus aureus]UXT11141.1 type II toxin-antitoxin system RelE/ParE family toxin [Staphylococcus aureus]UXT19166.1 type II toxin-antitoxin system RelE/ParE family toxin [Staphylococcus aureus]UXU11622.1 type II toxin-antitoxin system RelE/ParE family toxin [Staphylococcus aureus]UXU35514.1 type II toxin-antitoxin system RelE/ParE family toxin [Staphylococcus aureus]UXU40716.1 type II toxin-antitoxin system RelE/ParE family toxin [